jgi:hypothetical protein
MCGSVRGNTVEEEEEEEEFCLFSRYPLAQEAYCWHGVQVLCIHHIVLPLMSESFELNLYTPSSFKFQACLAVFPYNCNLVT